jgi:hypothetical protein
MYIDAQLIRELSLAMQFQYDEAISKVGDHTLSNRL